MNKEQEYIIKYDSIKNGYNITKGGEINYKLGKIICIETKIIYNDAEDVIIKNQKLFHNKITEKDIKDCCENRKKNIRLPWKKKDIYRHFQYYTSKTCMNINEIEDNYDISPYRFRRCRYERYKKNNKITKKVETRFKQKYGVDFKEYACSSCDDCKIYIKEFNPVIGDWEIPIIKTEKDFDKFFAKEMS